VREGRVVKVVDPKLRKFRNNLRSMWLSLVVSQDNKICNLASNLASFAFYQSAFQKSRMAVVFPILDSVGLSIPIIAGILVFKQTFNNYFLFFLAIFLIFIGTSALGRFQVDIKTMSSKKSSTSIKKGGTSEPI